jgi:pilus assembly protein CpaB
MKNRRLGLALVIAVIISVTATFFLYSRIKRQYALNAQPIKIVVASQALEPGTPLSADNLTLMDWPSNIPLAGSFRRPEEVNGRLVMFPIAVQEPIRDQLLAAPGATVGLTAKIPDGMRAAAVITNELNNVSGFLFPGSHVDVLVTFRAENGRDSMTTTALQNIEVLSAGEKLQPDPSGKPQNVKVVTLLLTPNDAERLALASNQGTVQFVLRNASDQAQAQQRPVNVKDLQGNAAPAVSVGMRKAAAPPKSASVYEVETFDGAKKGVVKF